MINKDLIFRRSLIEFDEKDIEHIYKYDDINEMAVHMIGSYENH